MNKVKKLPSLSSETVNYLRDTAMKIEADNLEVAKELMLLARLSRPNGRFIKKKLDRYNRMLNPSPSDLKLEKMLASGELAIIPIGFRCHTKMKISDSLGLEQPSFPFDNGFFPPSSIASIIKRPELDLNFSNGSPNHAVCIRDDNYLDSFHGRGLRFKKSTYEAINDSVTSRNMDGIIQYLDKSYGYYTLDIKHNFVLAHYNWHKFSDFKYSKGIYDPKENMDNTTKMLNRRIKRMFDICHAAKHILFVFAEDKNFNYMMIDDTYFDIKNIKAIKTAVEETFTAKSAVVNFPDVDSSEKVLALLK